MRTFFAFAFIAFLLGCDCETERTGPNACTSSDPINEIDWLIDMKNSIDNCSCEISILKGTYKNSPSVFFLLMNDPLCNDTGLVKLFNCRGELITILPSAEFVEQVVIDETLYSCNE